jgi:hypothetical protein
VGKGVWDRKESDDNEKEKKILSSLAAITGGEIFIYDYFLGLLVE